MTENLTMSKVQTEMKLPERDSSNWLEAAGLKCT